MTREDIRKKFPIGARVRYSDYAKKLKPDKDGRYVNIRFHYPNREGVVKSYPMYDYAEWIRILWDGRKTPDGLHYTLLERVESPKTLTQNEKKD